jgi:hypothetical protein
MAVAPGRLRNPSIHGSIPITYKAINCVGQRTTRVPNPGHFQVPFFKMASYFYMEDQLVKLLAILTVDL